jgi:hypothetical protein
LMALGGYGALVGLLRGWRQNAAWPLGFAALRWLGRMLLRGALWIGAALAILGLLSWFSPLFSHAFSREFIVTVLALLAAAALIPATVEQLRAEGMIAGRTRMRRGVTLTDSAQQPDQPRASGRPMLLPQGEVGP